jgi:phytoene synthase
LQFQATRPIPASDESIVRILQTKARTFAFASRFLPPEIRSSVAGLYAFCRAVDDLVDEAPPGTPPDELRTRLGAWRAWLEGWPDALCPPDPIAAALAAVIDRHGLPTAYLLLLIDGMESDVERVDVATWPELRTYCFRVASSVGLSMCHVSGVGHDAAALQAAVELGIAMQLTNLLRDVGEDLRSGRVYLPADELARHRYSRGRLVALAYGLAENGPAAMDDDFRMLMAAQIARARAYYARGLDGIPHLPPGCRLPILVAGRLYRAILDEIVAGDYDVFTRRASTSSRRKLGQAARCWAALHLARRAVPARAPTARFRLDDWATR